MNYSLGVCTSLNNAPLAAELGAEHIEPPFWGTANLDPQAFDDGLRALHESGLHVDAMNSMLPGNAVLYGTDAETEQTLDIVRRGMERAAAVGCQTVVLGSGTARKIPDGMTEEEAIHRFSAMAARFCEIAQPYGIRIAVEPLRAHETNFIHTVSDALRILAAAPHRTDLGVNPDIYHMLEGGEPFDALRLPADRLFHVHICAPDRHYPSLARPAEDNDLYRAFFRALNAADYRGTLSIEGIVTDMRAELPEALSILRAAMQDA